MRGASAESLATVLSAVESAVDGGAQAGELGDELFAVAGALDSAPALRRVLTDPSTDEAAKRGLAAQVFDGKVGARAVEVVQTAVAGRWSSGRDLADSLEQGGATAHVIGADAAGALDDVEDDLFRFGRVVEGDVDLRRALTDRAAPVSLRQQLVDRLLDGKASAAAVALARQAATARAGRSFEQRLAEFGDLAARRRDRLVAVVRTAYELDDAEKQRLAAALGRQYGRDVHVNAVVDTAVVGGVSVEIGDEVIDGTVAGRLEDARRRIAG